jgi:hypothetical protein
MSTPSISAASNRRVQLLDVLGHSSHERGRELAQRL